MKTKDVIAYYRQGEESEHKTRKRIAALLGIKVPATYMWGDTLPELRALQLEKLTSGRLAA